MKEKALSFLLENKEVAFATVENNRPKIRVFQIMRQEGEILYFATSAKKEVYQQLRINPYIEILVIKDKVSVRCSGKVNFDVPIEKQQWIYENNEVLPRLYASFDQLDYFSMKIEMIDYYDLKPTPPVLKHINLEDNTEHDGFVGQRFSK